MDEATFKRRLEAFCDGDHIEVDYSFGEGEVRSDSGILHLVDGAPKLRTPHATINLPATPAEGSPPIVYYAIHMQRSQRHRQPSVNEATATVEPTTNDNATTNTPASQAQAVTLTDVLAELRKYNSRLADVESMLRPTPTTTTVTNPSITTTPVPSPATFLASAAGIPASTMPDPGVTNVDNFDERYDINDVQCWPIKHNPARKMMLEELKYEYITSVPAAGKTKAGLLYTAFVELVTDRADTSRPGAIVYLTEKMEKLIFDLRVNAAEARGQVRKGYLHSRLKVGHTYDEFEVLLANALTPGSAGADDAQEPPNARPPVAHAKPNNFRGRGRGKN